MSPKEPFMTCGPSRAASVWLVFSGLLCLTSCSTTPIPSSHSVNVPAQRQMLFREPTTESATVVIVRDPGFYGSGCATRVLVNDRPAALVEAGEKVTFYIPAGSVILGAEPTGVCGGGRIEIEAKLDAGQKLFYRIAKSMSGPGFYRTTDR